MNKLISIFSTCLLASVVCADPVTVPNTFSAGTPAKAFEVNANFTALANAFNSIDLPTVYDSNGKIVGHLADGFGRVVVKTPENGYLIVGISKNSFVSFFSDPTRYYQTEDCTGIFYWDYDDSLVPGVFNYKVDGSSNNSIQNIGLMQGGSPTDINALSIRSRRYPYFDACEQIISNSQVSSRFLAIPSIVDLSGWVPPFSVH